MRFNLIIDKSKDEEITLSVHERTPLVDKIEEIISEFESPEKLIAYNDEEIKLLIFSDIECVTVIDGKTYAIDTKGSKLRLKKKLFELDEILPPYFIRINKSTIANEKRLEKFKTSFNGAVDACNI